MKETPIPYTDHMVEAILCDRKTKTRRVVKGLPLEWLQPDLFDKQFVADPQNNLCPYGNPGDLLWVRERHEIQYRAESSEFRITYSDGSYFDKYIKELSLNLVTKLKARKTLNTGKYVPGRFLPKELSRIWLQIESVTIELLQDITEQDAVDEGVAEYLDGTYKNYFTQKGLTESDGVECLLAKGSFQSLWCSINGLDSWNKNPYVWVIKFKLLSTTGRPFTLSTGEGRGEARKEATHA